MKKFVFSAIFFGFAILFSLNSAHAQNIRQAKANIPFDFVVKGKKFAAGEYTIGQLRPFSSSSVLHLKQKEGKEQMILDTLPNQLVKTEKTGIVLTFNRYGSEYFLTSIANTAASTEYIVQKSKTETQVAKQLGNQKPEIVSINLTNQ